MRKYHFCYLLGVHQNFEEVVLMVLIDDSLSLRYELSIVFIYMPAACRSSSIIYVIAKVFCMYLYKRSLLSNFTTVFSFKFALKQARL